MIRMFVSPGFRGDIALHGRSSSTQQIVERVAGFFHGGMAVASGGFDGDMPRQLAEADAGADGRDDFLSGLHGRADLALKARPAGASLSKSQRSGDWAPPGRGELFA